MVQAFDGLCNFRDLGGLPTLDGRVLRRGVLYRSEEFSRVSPADADRLGELGIRVICDLRSPRERAKKPARLRPDCGIRLLHVPIQNDATQKEIRNQLLGCVFRQASGNRYQEITHGYYQQMAFRRAERIGEVITLLARAENLPAVIHCTAGRDRTGLVAAMIQLLAGVAYGPVMREYLRTNECFAPRMEKFVRVMRVLTLFRISRERLWEMASARPEYLDEVHGRILAQYGSVGEYLRAGCGVDETALTALRERLVE